MLLGSASLVADVALSLRTFARSELGVPLKLLCEGLFERLFGGVSLFGGSRGAIWQRQTSLKLVVGALTG